MPSLSSSFRKTCLRHTHCKYSVCVCVCMCAGKMLLAKECVKRLQCVGCRSSGIQVSKKEARKSPLPLLTPPHIERIVRRRLAYIWFDREDDFVDVDTYIAPLYDVVVGCIAM